MKIEKRKTETETFFTIEMVNKDTSKQSFYLDEQPNDYEAAEEMAEDNLCDDFPEAVIRNNDYNDGFDIVNILYC